MAGRRGEWRIKKKIKQQRDLAWTMMIWGHTLIKRTNSSLYTCSLKLVGGIPSRGKDNYLEGRMRVAKSTDNKVNGLQIQQVTESPQ